MEAQSAELDVKLMKGTTCSHGDHWNAPPVPAVGFVHVKTPVDGGDWDVSEGRVVCIRKPKIEKPSYYHMALCAEHLMAWAASERCDCVVPGKWSLEVAVLAS
jgi:hypothetical protein